MSRKVESPKNEEKEIVFSHKKGIGLHKRSLFLWNFFEWEYKRIERGLIG